MMRRSSLFIALAVWPCAASAQQHGAPLNDTQKLGRLLYEQSCGICHTKPTLISPLYAPALSRETLDGREDVMRAFIANGTTRMPGFKTMYQPAQIDAIAQYVKTLPKPPAEPTDTAPRSGPRVQD